MASGNPLARPWRAAAEALLIAVKVEPKSRRPGVQGPAPAGDGERLRIGVTEAAEAGRANRAACATLARALDVAPSAVSVTAGQTNRMKTLRVAGNPAALAARLEALWWQP